MIKYIVKRGISGISIALLAIIFITLLAYALTGVYTSHYTIGNTTAWSTLGNGMAWYTLGYPINWGAGRASSYNLMDTILPIVVAACTVIVMITHLFGTENPNIKVTMSIGIGGAILTLILRAIIVAL